MLTDIKETALYFDEVCAHTKNYKAAANWVMVNVKSYLNENALDMDDFTLPATAIAKLIALIDEGKVSNSAAAQKIFPQMVANPQKEPLQIAEELNVIQESGADFLQEVIKTAVAQFPDKVAEYKAGKTSLLGLFMGEVMKQSKGKADPKVANKLLKEYLDTL